MEERLFRSKKEIAVKIAKTIKDIKLQYQDIDKQIRDSKLKHVTINVDTLIRSECKKFGVNETVLREIANWKNIRAGGSSSAMRITKEDKDDEKE